MSSTCTYNYTCPDTEIDRIQLAFTSNVIISTIIGFLLVIGLLGNAVVLITIIPDKRLKKTSNLFIVSLSCSDITSALICSPLWSYRRTFGFNDWQWPVFLCQFFWFADVGTNYVTSLHILSFAVVRYVAVKYPFRFKTISRTKTKIYIVFLWFISFLLAAPNLRLMSTGSIINRWPDCSICNSGTYQLYINVVYPICFYIPEVLVIIFSLLIVHQLIIRRRNRNKERKQNLRSTSFELRDDCTSSPQCNKEPTTLRKLFCYINLGLSTNESSNALCNDNIPQQTVVEVGDEITEDGNSDIVQTTTPNQCHSQIHCKSVGQTNETTSPVAGTDANAKVNTHYTSDQKGSLQCNRKEKKRLGKTGQEYVKTVSRQMIMITTCYIIGYIPTTIYSVWTTYTTVNCAGYYTEYYYRLDYWCAVVAYICLRISECMNPFMYFWGCAAMRSNAKQRMYMILKWALK